MLEKVLYHSVLSGLENDDHIQYLLASGGRALAGAWDMGSQGLTNVNIDSGTVDGITSLTVANNIDIGNYTLTANGLTIDGIFTDGTASLTGGALTSLTRLTATGSTGAVDTAADDVVVAIGGNGGPGLATFGSELVTDTEEGWTFGGDWSWNAGESVSDYVYDDDIESSLSQSISVVQDKTYRVSFDIANCDLGGSSLVAIGTDDEGPIVCSSEYAVDITYTGATGAATFAIVVTDAATSLTVTNVSVKEVTYGAGGGRGSDILFTSGDGGDGEAGLGPAGDGGDIVFTTGAGGTGGTATTGGDVIFDTSNGTGVRIGSAVAPTVTLDVTGDVKISETLAVDTDTLYVDPVNHRVGIETTTPNNAIQVAGLINFDDTLYNTLIGKDAGASLTTGIRNSAMGYYALRSNTTGNYNSAMGYQALYSNTTGNYNSAMGMSALYSNTTGNYNSAMGYAALNYNTTGIRNSAMGYQALYSNTTGNYNSAMGYYALRYNTTGNYNSAMGYAADFYVPSAITTTAAAVGTELEIGNYYYRVSYVLDTKETALSAYKSVTTTSGNQQVDLSGIPTYSGPMTCTARKIYRNEVGYSGVFYLVTIISDNTTTIYTDSMTDATLVGQSLPNDPDYAIMLGYNAKAFESNQLVLGSDGTGITHAYLGEGVYATTPVGITLHATGGQGTDNAGGDFTIAAGIGTGTGAGGDIIFQTAAAGGGSGDSANSLSDRVKIAADGTTYLGDGGTTNYTQISSTGDLSFAGSAGFYPRFLTQANEPAAGTDATQCDTSEMVIWKDSDDNRVYACFNDGGTVKTVELI